MNSQRNEIHSASHWMDIWACVVMEAWSHKLVIWAFQRPEEGGWMRYDLCARSPERSFRWSACKKKNEQKLSVKCLNLYPVAPSPIFLRGEGGVLRLFNLWTQWKHKIRTKWRHFARKPLKRLFMINLLLERDYREKNCWHTAGIFSHSRSPFGDQRKIRGHYK